jgi:hypothetical protein
MSTSFTMSFYYQLIWRRTKNERNKEINKFHPDRFDDVAG